MKTRVKQWMISRASLLALLGVSAISGDYSANAAAQSLQAGFGFRDITPPLPIHLAGYAARKRPADRVDGTLAAQAVVFCNPGGEKVVLITVDNCEGSRAFLAAPIDEIVKRHGFQAGQVMTTFTHTHSAPLLPQTLETMNLLAPADNLRIQEYGSFLQKQIVAAVDMAMADLRPAILEHGQGTAGFAMNRRVFREDRVDFGENLDGPVDHDVPVLCIRGTNGTVRAILFGYACHGTTLGGDDFYTVSGDFSAYARQNVESLYPGAMAMYLPGMSSDINPSPRSSLLDAKRHGLELAGSVVGVLKRSMRSVPGHFHYAFSEIELPLATPPSREQLLKDAQSKDDYIRRRAEQYLDRFNREQPLPKAIKLPVAVLRFGSDLTFLAMGGEPVVDYSIQLRRLFGEIHPWRIGYAFDIPCYIPSARILKEGGYEADSSLIYYGYYGPIKGQAEAMIIQHFTKLIQQTR